MSLAAFQITSKNISMACFGKHAKLLKAIEYKYVFDKPVRSSDRYFTVLARPNKLAHSRLGLAFTKKRVKKNGVSLKKGFDYSYFQYSNTPLLRYSGLLIDVFCEKSELKPAGS